MISWKVFIISKFIYVKSKQLSNSSIVKKYKCKQLEILFPEDLKYSKNSQVFIRIMYIGTINSATLQNALHDYLS